MVSRTGTIDDALAFAAAQTHAFVGICSPRRPNLGIMADEVLRQSLTPVPNPGRWVDFRLVEYSLMQHNIRIPRTPKDESECPGWMQMGFTLYDRLEEIGYQQYSGGEAERQYMEIYPHASYCALLGNLPFKKKTFEGRLQRQLVLFEKRLNIPDPMRVFEEISRFRLLNGLLPDDDLFTQGELDALVAAYTAWHLATSPDQTLLIGDTEEGQIVIPLPELKDHYS